MANRDEYGQRIGYDQEVKRMHDTYGPDAEIPTAPRSSYGQMTDKPDPHRYRDATAPMSPVTERISDLSKQIAEAGHLLSDARARHEGAATYRATCEARFTKVADELMRVIHEYREGTPENVPYQP